MCLGETQGVKKQIFVNSFCVSSWVAESFTHVSSLSLSIWMKVPAGQVNAIPQIGLGKLVWLWLGGEGLHPPPAQQRLCCSD